MQLMKEKKNPLNFKMLHVIETKKKTILLETQHVLPKTEDNCLSPGVKTLDAFSEWKRSF